LGLNQKGGFGRTLVLGHIYDMKNQFWAVGCGLGWKVKKKVWADYKQLLKPVFLSFHWQKINLNFFCKYCRVRTEKLHRIKVKKSQKKFGKYFLRGKNQFLLRLKI
jgi:hypothetical protein